MKTDNLLVKDSFLYETEEAEPPSTFQLIVSEQKDTSNQIEEAEQHSIFPVSEKSLLFLKEHFPGVSIKEWNNWRWQIKNSFTTFESLKKVINISDREKEFYIKGNLLPLRITPYYASLLDRDNANQAIRRSVVPEIRELIVSPGEEPDPLGEENDSPVNHIVHRYPDRALFLATGFCSTYCRYCTRSHMVSKKDKCHASQLEWINAINYIKNHPEIRDVIVSGGDPLTLPDAKLEFLLSSLRSIEHVEIIRIGTKVPVVLPQRITTTLLKMLKKYHPLFMSVHFTHPDEMTIETKTAFNRIADAGIPIGSQTVLLKGINDNVETFTKLVHELLKARVKPYYLYQCDPIPGSAHFRTSVNKGLEIIKGIRGFTSGYAIPHYVIDAPGGGGKIPLLPDYFEGKNENNELVLHNYMNRKYYYPEIDNGF
jgi:lysine 2,3-aminomutase